MKKALFVYGGWDGHTPKQCVDLFAPWLEQQGYAVEISDSLDAYSDADHLKSLNLIIPTWTMGELTPEQEINLCDAVAGGVGHAGWHGGACDAFRSNTQYQFMIGAQFVAHPGNLLPAWDVKITNREHDITRGIDDFTMRNTERYYLHIDPSINVLAATRFEDGFDMPVVWTRQWHKGRIACASFGHTDADFATSEALEIVHRCLLWATA